MPVQPVMTQDQADFLDWIVGYRRWGGDCLSIVAIALARHVRGQWHARFADEPVEIGHVFDLAVQYASCPSEDRLDELGRTLWHVKGHDGQRGVLDALPGFPNDPAWAAGAAMVAAAGTVAASGGYEAPFAMLRGVVGMEGAADGVLNNCATWATKVAPTAELRDAVREAIVPWALNPCGPVRDDDTRG